MGKKKKIARPEGMHKRHYDVEGKERENFIKVRVRTKKEPKIWRWKRKWRQR